MVDFTQAYKTAGAREISSNAFAGVMNKVYSWMAAGLAVSAGVAFYVRRGLLTNTLELTPGMVWGCLIGELALVFALTFFINKLSAFAATVMFLVYSALSGATLALIMLAYSEASVFSALVAASGSFLTMAVLGTFAKRSLTSIGSLCFAGLIAVIVSQIILAFFPSARGGMLDTGISVIGVLVFLGLAAYDAQKIKVLAMHSGELDKATVDKLAIMGALSLYLDFVNLFLMLLRIFGNRK